MDQMTIGILMGLGFTALMALAIFFDHDYNLKDCKGYGGVLFLQGIAACLIFGGIGWRSDIDEKINNTIKTTINANYDNVVNYHNDIGQQSFISDGSKYTFDYDDETKTLTVFTDISANVDAVFIDGVKQNNQKTSDKTDKKKDCVSYKTDDADKTDADKINSKPDITSSSSTASSTAVSLQQKIQDKIQSRYNDAVITGFDTIKMSGTFSCDNVQYNFQWKDDMLEVINADDADDVTYYKVAQ